jgi:hypothetical protein
MKASAAQAAKTPATYSAPSVIQPEYFLHFGLNTL